MTNKNKKINSNEELQRAEECLKQAEAALKRDEFLLAVSQAYYSVFHAARAVLFSIGEQVKTHRGIIFLFDQNFVITGKIEPEYVAILTRLSNLRGYSDYGPYNVITPDKAKMCVEQADKFYKKIKQLV